ncbi:type IV pilin protein [Vibrio campbellii]|uniref:type IV pilin protein n=1 Tax=Vibrio campbellii TaxID=680 RepID=UPI0003A13585|nr:prepilin-type N-terminal cleavage/methylation domain-containing protein [Vibrio campbellii]
MIRISGCNGYNRRLRGMTLIELLIAVVIVGIIAAIAYPSYSNHAITAHRTVALSDISRIQLELETTYNGGYDWSGIISGGHCTICDSDSDRFSFDIVSSASFAYKIEASALSTLGQDNDSCFASDQEKKITLTSTNIESPSACWD